MVQKNQESENNQIKKIHHHSRFMTMKRTRGFFWGPWCWNFVHNFHLQPSHFWLSWNSKEMYIVQWLAKSWTLFHPTVILTCFFICYSFFNVPAIDWPVASRFFDCVVLHNEFCTFIKSIQNIHVIQNLSLYISMTYLPNLPDKKYLWTEFPTDL